MSILFITPPVCRARAIANAPTCSQKPQLPEGAQQLPEPTFSSPLERRLTNLSFAYEHPDITASCTLRYRCKHGHIVKCRPGSPACVTCPICSYLATTPSANKSRTKLSLYTLQTLAAQRKGTLLSTEYVDSRTPLVWRCEHGHVWKANASNVRSAGSWCPECARQKQKLTIKDMHKMAAQLGGECLSTEYISEHVPLKWRCAHGHEFLLAPNNIRRRSSGARKPSWCKICRRNGVPIPELELSK